MEGFMNLLGVFITGIVITRIIITIQMMKQYKKIQQQRQQQTSSINDSDAIKQPQGEMIYRPVDIEIVQDHVTGKQISNYNRTNWFVMIKFIIFLLGRIEKILFILRKNKKKI